MKSALFLLVLLLSPSAALGQDLEADRLELWFSEARDDIETTQLIAGPLSIGVGALVLGTGTAALIDDVYPEQPNLAWLQVGVGTFGVLQWVVWLLIHPDPEQRFSRFREARAGGLDESERLRFEGELRAYRNIAQMQRALFRWSGLGLMFGGAVVLGALPLQDELPSGHQVMGYVSAGAYVAVGVSLFVASFIPTYGENGFQEYEQGRSPQLSLSPWINPDGLGLSASGRF